MKQASALATITNPTINHYKRIHAPRAISGAPHTVTGTGNTRTHPHGFRDAVKFKGRDILIKTHHGPPKTLARWPLQGCGFRAGPNLFYHGMHDHWFTFNMLDAHPSY